jgi:hypothetical protein
MVIFHGYVSLPEGKSSDKPEKKLSPVGEAMQNHG